MAKRYYWLKLKEDFFNQKEIKRLRRIAGGDTYTIIYLKMLLRALKTDGKIYFEGIGDDFADELALDIDEDIDNVKMTISYLQTKNLLEVVDESEYMMTELPDMVGSETDKAAMMRRKRARDKEIEAAKSNKVTKNGNSITEALPERYTEREIEKEIDIEKEKDRASARTHAGEFSEKQEGASFGSPNKKDPFVFFQDNFGVMSPFIRDNLLHWTQDADENLIIYAMEIALKKNKPFNYAEAILTNWHNRNITTVEAAKSEEKDFQRKKKPQNKYERMEDYKNAIGRTSY